MNVLGLSKVLQSLVDAGFKHADVKFEGDKMFVGFTVNEVPVEILEKAEENKKSDYHLGCYLILDNGRFFVAGGKSDNSNNGNYHEKFGYYYASVNHLTDLNKDIAIAAVKMFGSNIKFTTKAGKLIVCYLTNDMDFIGYYDYSKKKWVAV